MANPIYKRDGQFQFPSPVDPYMVKTPEEVEKIPESRNAQFVWIVGDGSGSTMKLRLPGGEWTEV